MSNLVPITASTGAFPSLPEALMQDMAAQFAASFNGLSGDTRRIKVRKVDFALVDGGAELVIPNGSLEVVILAAASENHAVWYERAYAPGQEPEAPDLVWIRPNETVYPEALPVQFRSKVKRDGGTEGWAYQIRRRIAVAVIRTQADGSRVIDLDNPYVMDLPSMSLYGKGAPAAGFFKLSGLGALCKQMSARGVTVTPAMFPTKILIDPNVSVSGVVAFQPVMQGGMPAFFDAATIGRIYETVVSDAVADMLTVKEKLTYTSKGVAAQTVVQPAAQSVVQPAAQSVVQPAAQPVVQPAAQSVVQPAAQPVVQPAAQPVVQPVATTTEAEMLAQASAALNVSSSQTATNAQSSSAPSSDTVKQNVAALLGRLAPNAG